MDTNILVYATAAASPYHNNAVQALAGEPAREGAAVSRQVLREYLAVMSRTQVHGGPQPASLLAAAIARFEASFTVLEDGPAVTAQLINLMQQVAIGGKQVHDANVVATMLAHGMRRLLTANIEYFARFAPWIELLPWP